MSTDQKQYWWEEVTETMGDFRSRDISGDVIIGQAGAGSQNVAIGKNITQTVYQVVGEPTPEDRTIIEEAVAEVRTELEAVENLLKEKQHMAVFRGRTPAVTTTGSVPGRYDHILHSDA